MRITSCSIQAFGQLADRRFDDLDLPIVVVVGPNEAGKSTFFRFLQTMLYGVYPTDADKHEYAPRDGRRLEGDLTFRARNSTTYSVSRKLMSAPQGQFVRQEGVVDLRNQTVPLVSHISQDVFDAVYALTLYDLAALADAKAWQGIQDRLLGSLSIDYIRSAREVSEEIEEEATSLWRNDRRGKPAAKQLQEQIRDLRERAREAKDRDEKARELDDRISVLEQELSEKRRERIELEAAKRRIERLRPLRDRLAKIRTASEEAGDPEEIRALPRDPGVRLSALSDALDGKSEELRQLQAALDQAREVTACVSQEDEKVIEAAADIRSLAKRAESFQVQLKRLDEAQRSLASLDTRVDERASGLLAGEWNEDAKQRIESLSRSELGQAMAAFEDAQSRYDEAAAKRLARLEATEGRVNMALRVGTAALMVIIVIAAVAGGVYEVAISAAVVGFGFGVWTWQGHKHNARLRRLDEADRSSEMESMLDARRRKIKSLLEGIPIPAERLETPDSYLTTELSSLQDVLESRRQLGQTADGLEADLRGERSRVAQLTQRVGIARDDHEDVASIASLLESMLDAAEKRARRAGEAAETAKELESRTEHQCREVERLRDGHTALVAGLQRLGEGDSDRGIRVYNERMKALQRLEAFREDLDRDFPHLERLKAEIAELDQEDHRWDLSDEEVIELNHRLEELVEGIGETERHLAEARKDIEHLLELPTLDQIESERDRLRAEVDEIEAKRDRLMLLANLVRFADKRFREEHQPDVLRRASDYLRRITNGRYDRLDYDDSTNTLRVFEADDAFGFFVGSPLSQGTRDQIYLAVRLAIVDHLDDGQERLPVFLDEVFVNWDAARRDQFYDILRDVSKRRQIFVFTCHEWLAQEIDSRFSAALVDLAGTPVHV